MDAFGRYFTNENLLFGLSSWLLGDEDSIEAIIESEVKARERISNPSREFGDLIEEFVGTQTTRLCSYLVEYICWFEEFLPGTNYYKLNASVPTQEITHQRLYIVESPTKENTLLTFRIWSKNDKDT